MQEIDDADNNFENDELLSESSWDPNDDNLAYLEIPHIQPDPALLSNRKLSKKTDANLTNALMSAARN